MNPKVSRRKEIKSIAEINEIENRKTIEQTNKNKIHFLECFPSGSEVKICLPIQEMKELLVWSLGWKDPLE